MRRLILAAALVPTCALAAAPAMAHETDVEATMDQTARILGDPARQQAMARSLGTMAEVLLDLPLAPILNPMAEAAGEDPRAVDPDTTLRRMSPEAGAIPRRIERDLPRTMNAMAGMSAAIAELGPQLRDMADRVRETLPDGAR